MTARPQQMKPLVSSGLFGNWDATIRSSTVPNIRTVGTRSVTTVFTSAVTRAFSFRKRKSSTGMVSRAPASTAKAMPGLPRNQKKSLKLMFMYPASRIEVVSPTRVAAPCRLLETAMAMSRGTGLVFSCLATARPTGATISTVATLSTKAEMTPEKTESATAAHWMVGTFCRSFSAIRPGIRLWMKSSTVAMVPASIISTFQLMAPRAADGGRMPMSRNTSAAPRATSQRCSDRISSSTYITAKRISARIIEFIPEQYSF